MNQQRAAGGASGPWLQTERLDLWRPTPHDVEAVFAIHADPETYRHLPSGRMQEGKEAESLIDVWGAHWEKHGFGYAVVRERGGDAVLGFTGMKHQTVLGRDVLNVYYRFAPAAWGRGFATEALAGVLDRLAPESERSPVVARIATNNPESESVVARLDFAPVERQDPRDPVPHRLWVRGDDPFGA